MRAMRAKKLARVEAMFRRAVARARADDFEIGSGGYGIRLSDDGEEFIPEPPLCPTGAVLYYHDTVARTLTERLRAWFWPWWLFSSGDLNRDAARLLGTRSGFVLGFVWGFDGNHYIPLGRDSAEGYLLGQDLREEFCPVPPARTTEAEPDEVAAVYEG